MGWISSAFFGFIVGWLVFAAVWATLASGFATTEEEKQTPPWTVSWAMSIAFMLIALLWPVLFLDAQPSGSGQPAPPATGEGR
jgi:biotin transporter BioY